MLLLTPLKLFYNSKNIFYFYLFSLFLDVESKNEIYFLTSFCFLVVVLISCRLNDGVD